jgi:hypothetical protein
MFIEVFSQRILSTGSNKKLNKVPHELRDTRQKQYPYNLCVRVCMHASMYRYLQQTATLELVRTTFFTDLACTHALRIACVPSTAGVITSLSSFGAWDGLGLATCITYVTSCTALNSKTIKFLIQCDICYWKTIYI